MIPITHKNTAYSTIFNTITKNYNEIYLEINVHINRKKIMIFVYTYVYN